MIADESEELIMEQLASTGESLGHTDTIFLTKIKALEASLASFILEETASLEASPMQLGQLQPALEDNGGGMRSIRNIAKPHYYIVDGDSVELIDRDSIVESTVSRMRLGDELKDATAS